MTRKEAIEELEYIKDSFVSCTLSYDALDMAIEALKQKPAVKGKWISENHPVYGDEYCMCSVCKRTRWKWNTVENLKYCPDCGADMWCSIVCEEA